MPMAMTAIAGEGEESIRSHDGSLEREAHRCCLADRLPQRLHPRGLTVAGTQDLTILGEDYSVALAVLYRLHRKEEIFRLALGGRRTSDHSEILSLVHKRITLLHQYATQGRSVL